MHSINKFMLLFIPQILLTKAPSIIAAIVVTSVPYTPVNIIVFTGVFLFIYMTNIFGMGSKTTYACKYNKLNATQDTSIWQTIKSSYIFYFIIAYTVNLFSIFEYRSLSKLSNLSNLTKLPNIT